MGGRAGERRQIDRAQFVYTIDRVNAIFLDAESVNRANVTESILGYLSCYVSYAIIKTHYEKVRASCFLSARVRAQCADPLISLSARHMRLGVAPQCMDVLAAFLDEQNTQVYRPAGFELKHPLRNGFQSVRRGGEGSPQGRGSRGA